ncbi:MAG TPA: adenylate cyclase regulatory domain-containing protein [Actinomycetota bacterium]|nr:adenylate cyclase regulatory domain-containing protein [Actinomycetota bacterium]
MPEAPAPPPAERFTPAPTLTASQVAARAGLDLDLARRVWRALGMPEAGDDEVMFDDRDVQALTALRGILELGVPADELLAIGRLYGQAMSRIADAETRMFRERLLAPAMAHDGEPVEERLRPVVEALLDISARLLDQTHRRKLMLALDALGAGGSSESLAAGFADLVAFSRISEDLAAEELGGLVEAFEDLAVNVCADAGARLVKVIGDGVMFVAVDPARALAAATDIVAGASEHPLLPEARAGLDFGQAVALGGDYFGRPVNVAARITAYARADTVVLSGEFLEALGDGDLRVSRIGKRRLKGVGGVSLFKVKEA